MRNRLALLSLSTVLLTPIVLVAQGAARTELVRYPHYHEGRIAFTYLADIWTAREDGSSPQRLTVHGARDAYPRFSPDGRWIAFSSDRMGGLDVYIIPTGGGTAKQLTFHSADDVVLGWSPDSKSVLFSSQRGEDFAAKLYTVGLDGGMPRNVGADMGIYASFSPDGRRLAINRKSQSYWRKFYRGSSQSDVTVMDVAAKKFTDVTDFNGMDTWPMWSGDGYIYFVSDREGEQTNIHRVSERGGAAERVTTFASGDVRWPAMSADGKTIVFEHDFGVWKLDVASRRATPIPLSIAAEISENLVEYRDFRSEADDYDLAPTGRRVALSVHGEIFTAPAEEGDLVQVTDSPFRDRSPEYSPDGRWIAYISDASGREELYVASADGAGAARKITDVDALKLGFTWSPDSREIVYTASDSKLRRVNVETKQSSELASSVYGAIGAPAWSPDGKWITYARPDFTRTNDIYLIAATGGEERRVTFDSYHEASPRFSPDGRKLYFVRTEGFGFGPTSLSQLFAVTLERETRDPNDPEEEAADSVRQSRRAERVDSATRTAAAARQPGVPRVAPGRPVTVDFAGLKRRTRQITRMPFSVNTYAVAPDGRTIVFATSEPSGTRSVPVLYSIQETGRRLTRIIAGATAGSDEDAAPAAGGPGSGMGDLNFSSDGRTLFFREGRSIYSVGVPQGSSSAASSSMTASRGDAARRQVNFTAKVKIDRPAEWAQMFDDAWRTMKYRFYDPKMHGKDWDAMRAKYRPLVESVGDRQELLNVVNEMIGELNASHTGAAPPPGGRSGGAATGHLGVELEADEKAGRYRVTHVYEEGPADKDWVKVSAGDYLIAINGKQVKAGDNYWPMLNHRLNRKVEVTFNNRPADEGAWKTRIEPSSQGAYSQLRYERWVKQRREMTDKLSGGRIGYVHIQGMNQPSLRRFEKELRENRDKEALVIDQRWNGGGNIEQELLALLVQRQYQVWQPRGTEPTTRPFAGFFGPKVVLQNWRSASNAEMFPAGFRALGLGKVIGTPTAGAVIGTGSYSLIDGSTVRTPGVGVFLADEGRTNMENTGVQPDILVENAPEEVLSGKDRQLEVGVQELLKELGAPKAKATPRVKAGT